MTSFSELKTENTYISPSGTKNTTNNGTITNIKSRNINQI